MGIAHTTNKFGTLTISPASYGLTASADTLTLELTQNAYMSNYGTEGGVRYYASAEDCDGNGYLVAWDTSEQWNDAEAACQLELAKTGRTDGPFGGDESYACDWNTPAKITLA